MNARLKQSVVAKKLQKYRNMARMQNNMKKVLRGDTNTAHWQEAEPKIFTELQTPFPEASDSQNLISWRWSLPSPTNPVW